MQEIMRINSAKFNMEYFLSNHPTINENEIESYMYVSPYDIFIKFTNGSKFIYDQSNNYLRPIYFKDNNLTEEEFKREFSYRLTTYMERHYISQKSMAEKIGVGYVMMNRYCQGLVIPNLYRIQLIAQVLRYPLESFFYIDIDHVYNM